MNKEAFTLVELGIVAIIVGVLVLVGIPNMLKSINRNYALDAMRNLITIYTAEHNYAQNNGNYLIPCDLDCINNASTGLGLNIISSNGVIYSCRITGVGGISLCEASSGLLYQLIAILDNPINSTAVPVYCNMNGAFPFDTYNPCCWHNGSKTPGTNCP